MLPASYTVLILPAVIAFGPVQADAKLKTIISAGQKLSPVDLH
jgi:hypothetical protein